MSDLDAPLLGLPGVGPKTAERLAAAGLRCVGDVLMLLPRRWDDLRRTTPIADLGEGVAQTTAGRVASARVVFGGRRFFEVRVEDDGGAKLVARWFHFRGALKERFPPGQRLLLSGVVRRHQGALQMIHPETVLLDGEAGGDADRGAGVRVRYPEIDGVGATVVARLCREVALRFADRALDGIPPEGRRRFGLPGLGEALRALHLVDDDTPPEGIEALEAGDAPAQRRLAFDELFFLQLALARRRDRFTRATALPCPLDAATTARFLDRLPYTPTGAQRRAIAEIGAALALDRPMHRLLQGDVGAGKTVVIFAAALQAMATSEGRGQVAVMAPTELLAEQHARTFAAWLRVAGDPAASARDRVARTSRSDDERAVVRPRRGSLQLALLTASTPRHERDAIRAGLASGAIDLVVGTHALLGGEVRFARLSLVVVDEQHRFGVAQRAALRDKASDRAGRGGRAGRDDAGAVDERDDRQPHLLVTTATPIPRTLALTLHGDLDVTTLDERPPGRPPIETRLLTGARGRVRAWAELGRRLADGDQGYVVCPVIDGGDGGGDGGDNGGQGGSAFSSSDLSGVEATFARLQRELPHLPCGLLHGRLSAAERDQTMRRFAEGELRLLVTTTVIEVGVDVPGAQVMLIDGAERFGLAQLHQLRGRIGRAAIPPPPGKPPTRPRGDRAATGDPGRRAATGGTGDRAATGGTGGRAATGDTGDRAATRGTGDRAATRGTGGPAATGATGAVVRPLCLLCTPASLASDAGRRLAALAATDDGFAIAEADLAARGPGELLGTRQAGLPRLRFADLTRHLPLLRGARDAAQALIAADPDLTDPEHAATRAVLEARLRAAAAITG